MSSAMIRETINIPSSDRTGAGKVTIAMRGGTAFRIRCTVPGCGWRLNARGWSNAQQAAFRHARTHQFGE